MSDRGKDIRRRAAGATDEAARRWHETGELSHLYGKPLDLADDPDWLATRALKQNGFSHPLIELGRELAAPREAAERVGERLRRRHRNLLSRSSRSNAQDVYEFNRWRLEVLEEYREKIRTLNAAIRDYNLQAPDALQQMPVVVDDAAQRLANEVPELSVPTAPASSARPRRLFGRFRQRGERN